MVARELTTKRLRLMPADLDDVDAFHSILIDPGVRRYLCDDRILPREDALGFVNAGLESLRSRGMGLWLAYSPNGGDALGFFLLRPLEAANHAELLYALLPAHWGGGLAVEGARAIIDYAFTTLDCDEILAELDEPNEASARVAKKLGMTFAGTRPGPAHTLLKYTLRREDHNAS